jgi:hypothetical protein
MYLGFYRISGQLPSVQTTEQGVYAGIAILYQDQRRTGAVVFSRSCSVENYILIFGKFFQA